MHLSINIWFSYIQDVIFSKEKRNYILSNSYTSFSYMWWWGLFKFSEKKEVKIVFYASSNREREGEKDRERERELGFHDSNNSTTELYFLCLIQIVQCPCLSKKYQRASLSVLKHVLGICLSFVPRFILRYILGLL